jgi:hypothetical protein
MAMAPTESEKVDKVESKGRSLFVHLLLFRLPYGKACEGASLVVAEFANCAQYVSDQSQDNKASHLQIENQ